MEFRPELNLRVGEVVEVRSAEEILRSLDANGSLDSLPFMPEMLRYAGKRFRVFKSAHKTCDTIDKTGGRRMTQAVHLENLRCDGEFHGGCEAGCLLFWKEAWLKRIGPEEAEERSAIEAPRGESQCTEAVLMRATHTDSQPGDTEEKIFCCQATQLKKASAPLNWWDVRQYVRDVRSGNVGFLEAINGFLIMTFKNGLGRLSRLPGGYRLALKLASLGRGLWRIPQVDGKLIKTPRQALNLQPGEVVYVKELGQIVQTLDRSNSNRGLWFDVEMAKYCGRRFKVQKRVGKIVNEKSGRLMTFANDCIVLEGVICGAHYSEKRLFCPRSIPSYWREIWLERVDLQDSSGCLPSEERINQTNARSGNRP